MQLLKPTKFPHVPPYAYTKFGFDHRLRKRLRREGFSVREIERLRQLVLRSGLFFVFCDDDGNVLAFTSPRTVHRRGSLLL